MEKFGGIKKRAETDSLVSYIMDGAYALPIGKDLYHDQVITELLCITSKMETIGRLGWINEKQ